jgi:hypothetical protein
MIRLQLPQHQQARVWIGDLPFLLDKSTEIVEPIKAAISKASPATEWRGAIEVLVPKGGRFLYGLLGGDFYPSPQKQFIAKVASGTTYEVPYAESIASTLDDVKIGLPQEYAGYIMEGIRETAGRLKDVPAGTLTVNCAAHGQIGSCGFIFEKLGAMLVRLLVSGNTPISEPDIISIISSELLSR